MNIYEAITGIMSEGYAIAKDKKNQQQGFKYRGIDDVMNTFQPLLAKYKVFCVPEVIDATREEHTTAKGGKLLYAVLTIKYTFYAEDGSSVAAVVIGEGMDSGDKASNKAMAIAMKYAMFQTFCIPTEEMANDDPDRERPELKPEATATPPQPAPKTVTLPPHSHVPEDELAFKCDVCQRRIAPYPGTDGKMVGVRKHVEASKKMFGGRTICVDCIKAMQTANEANENAD